MPDVDPARAALDLDVLRSRSSAAPIAPPPRRWLTRAVVPAALLLGIAAILFVALRDVLLPGVDVMVVPAIEASRGSSHAAGSSAPNGLLAESADVVVAQAAGWLEPDPFAVNIAALTSGTVREVLVLDGQRVEVGEVVARLVDDDALLVHRRAVAERRERAAELLAAEAALTSAQETWDNPVERTRMVETSRALLDGARAAVEVGRAQVKAAAALVEQLRDELERNEPLVRERAVSELEVVRLRLRLAAADAELEQATAKVPELVAKVAEMDAADRAASAAARLRTSETLALQSALADVERAKAMLDRAEAMVLEAELALRRTEVVALAAGVVLERLVEPGSRIELGSDDPQAAVIARTYDPAKLQVRVDVPLADATKVLLGQSAEITTEALPGRLLRGRVARLVHEANIERNTVQVKVAVDAPDDQLRPEMLCRVRFLGSGGESARGDQQLHAAAGVDVVAVTVPRTAVRRDAEGAPSAWIVDRASARIVSRALVLDGPSTATTSPARSNSGESVVVSSGLRPGDRVIVDAPAGAGPGTRVRNALERSAADRTAAPTSGGRGEGSD